MPTIQKPVETFSNEITKLCRWLASTTFTPSHGTIGTVNVGECAKVSLVHRSRISVIPCQSEENILGCRFPCSFQMISIPRDSVNSNSAYGNESGDDETTLLQYSMRHSKETVPLNENHFLIVTKRIQPTMAQVLEYLNDQNLSQWYLWISM